MKVRSIMTTKYPAYFVSHGGGPWPYVDGMKQMYEKTAREFSALPRRLPGKPKAVLVISGHWEAQDPTVSTAVWPPMEYDYYGFPRSEERLVGKGCVSTGRSRG